MFGKEVWNISGSKISDENINVDLSSLRKGVYFVNVNSGKINRTKKLVIN